MFINKDWVKEKGACTEGFRYFIEHFPEGAEYQSILDVLAKDNQGGYADWLMKHAGRTDAVLEVDGDLEIEGNLFFAGMIKVSGFIKASLRIKAGSSIEAGLDIKAGWGIEAGWGIKAGSSIEAGSDIKAGEGIEAGEDYGIYAGLRIRVSLKAKYALVVAKEMPNNLLLGIFKPRE